MVPPRHCRNSILFCLIQVRPICRPWPGSKTLRLIKAENVPIFNGFSSYVNSGSQQQTTADYCHVAKKVKKDNITPENIGEIILCQIPGISSITAIAIMKHFNHFTHFMEEITKDFSCIENLTIESNGKVRKISKKSIESIQQYLLNITK